MVELQKKGRKEMRGEGDVRRCVTKMDILNSFMVAAKRRGLGEWELSTLVGLPSSVMLAV